MTTQVAEKLDRYLADQREFQAEVAAKWPAWTQEVREQGATAFERLGFPTQTRGNEKWKFSSVASLAGATFAYPFEVDTASVSKKEIQAHAPWNEKWTRLVFIDGRYSPTLSNNTESGGEGARICSLGEAIRDNVSAAGSYINRLAEVENDGFTALNTAFLRDGAFINLPDGETAPTPVHVIFVTTERAESVVTYPRLLVNVGKNSRLTLIESYVGLAETEYFTDAVHEMVIEDGGKVDHYRYMMESSRSFHIAMTRVLQKRDSEFKSMSFSRGARIARNDLHVLLDAPGAECSLNGLYYTTGTQHIDNHINIDHLKHHTNSDLYFKGILADRSRAVFSGRVVVHKDAQKVVANQKDQNLLLSEGARINTKPSLEIFADDVKCAHGATAGAVAPEALFYMRSRGIDEETAREILIHGFASEIVDRVTLEPLREYLDELFAHGLPGR